MARSADLQIEHLLRRAGFGARPDELENYRAMSLVQAVDTLVNYTLVPDTVDGHIGKDSADVADDALDAVLTGLQAVDVVVTRVVALRFTASARRVEAGSAQSHEPHVAQSQ